MFTFLVYCFVQGIKGAKGFVGDNGSAGIMGDMVCMYNV